MFFWASLMRSSVIGWEENTFAIVPGFFFSIDWIFSKKSTNAVGIVSGLVHVLQAEHIGFLLERAGELQEAHRNQNARRLPDAIARPAAHEDQRDRWRVDDLPARRLPRAVPRRDVSDLVRHHACELGFVLRLQDQPGVHEEEAARQRHRVHFFGVQHLDRDRHLRVRVADEVLADAIDVLGDDRIVDDFRLALDLLRDLLAERDLLLDRVEVDALADVAIADGIGIFLFVLCVSSWLSAFSVLSLCFRFVGLFGGEALHGARNQHERRHQSELRGNEALHS